MYKMDGVRGATFRSIDLFEVFTHIISSYISRSRWICTGIATCSGSAVFNAVVIPAVCILAVTIKGVNGNIVESLLLRRRTIIRDGFFFILAEICLIIFLGTGRTIMVDGTTSLWVYMTLYFFTVLMRGLGRRRE